MGVMQSHGTGHASLSMSQKKKKKYRKIPEFQPVKREKEKILEEWNQPVNQMR